jgi:hypothetical protein
MRPRLLSCNGRKLTERPFIRRLTATEPRELSNHKKSFVKHLGFCATRSQEFARLT